MPLEENVASTLYGIHSAIYFKITFFCSNFTLIFCHISYQVTRVHLGEINSLSCSSFSTSAVLSAPGDSAQPLVSRDTSGK